MTLSGFQGFSFRALLVSSPSRYWTWHIYQEAGNTLLYAEKNWNQMVQTMCTCEHPDSNEQQDGEHSFQDWFYETEKLLSELLPQPALEKEWYIR